jgi:RNA polymerase sigma-70 factor, ECF subfamily
MAMTAAEPSHREQASTPASQAFEQLAEPFRRELKLHGYRMLGSVHEAEDLAQETYLRAWRNFDSFEGRGSFRAWLYRIATNACLDALASRKNVHRLLPDQRAPAAVQMPDGVPATDVAWLEPCRTRTRKGSPTTRRIRRRAMPPERLCSSPSSPSSRSCRRASAPRSCRVT